MYALGVATAFAAPTIASATYLQPLVNQSLDVRAATPLGKLTWCAEKVSMMRPHAQREQK